MSLPSYPEYKKSSRQVLHAVPSSWNLIQLRRLAPVIESGTSVNALDNEPSQGQPSVLKTSCVYTGKFRPEECKEIVEEEIEKASCPVKGGSLIVSRMNTPELVGAAGLVESDIETLFLPDRLWQVRLGKATSHFVYYWTQSSLYRDQVKSACSGTSSSMQNLSQENFLSFYAALPSKEEQQTIASFLDRETAKIDALITEQQCMIELLQEKKQAVISHAVTKGLNPNAPMKDSGVEWLGEVPEHWEVCSLSHTLKAIGDVDHYMPSTVAEGVPYLMTGDLQELTSQIDFNDCKQVSHEEYEKLSRKIKTANGDLIMARYATIGTVAYVDVERDLLVSYSCVTMKPNMDRTCGMFLFYCLKSDSFSQGIKHKINANTQENVGIGDLKKVKVAIPPLNEQQQISEYLQAAITEMTKVIQASKDTVRLLHERRSALISAAVTGQIDVRGLVKSEAGEQ